MKKAFIILVCIAGTSFIMSSCKQKAVETPAAEISEIQKKVEEFAFYDLKSPDLIAQLSESEKQLIPIFIQIADIMDKIYWKQIMDDKSFIDTIQDPYVKDFIKINYGPWEHLNDFKPFVAGFGEKPRVCQFYPNDITEAEFDALNNPDKKSLYTVLRRNEDGTLKVVWYREEYKAELDRVCELLDQAIELAEDNGLKNYLIERKKAFQTDDYFASDMAWMDMKESKIDFVVGPIESYDDKFQGIKTSYESFILLKDVERSNNLSKYTSLLPNIQKELPCDPKYKTFVPGTSSDINVYDVIYYAGDCNAGSKTIAINLPNDDRVAGAKGTRRLQLRNSMQAKYDKIIIPIGDLVLTPEEKAKLNFDAFFWNVTLHEVSHGLGVKNTINGKGAVDKAMKTEGTAWEEAKADIVGLFLACKLINMGEITNITEEEAITTYITGLLRSVRFGFESAHGSANLMCFNYMMKNGAFQFNEEGKIIIDYDKSKTAIEGWANLILTTQGDGNFEFAQKYRKENAIYPTELKNCLDSINNAGIARDIRFNQGLEVLGLTK